jgi:hypothetical protein
MRVAIVLLLVTAACSGGDDRSGSDTPAAPGGESLTSSGEGCAGRASVVGHPRLWVTEDDLPALRAAASADNPVYESGLRAAALEGREEMDLGELGDDGGSSYWEEYPNENYAQLFAFMSLVGPEGERADWACRARAVLMRVIDEAAKGVSDSAYRAGNFALSDRSRYWGSGFGLTVDWIYPYLSGEDKATIRAVFLRWSAENEIAETTTLNHPEPVGLYNDPVLIQDIAAVRFSGNNYYTAHMRNLGLMAMALDPADDPDGQLAGYLRTATGAYLYVFDHLTRTESAGGQLAEGFEYSPQTAAYAGQLLLALSTAGEDDPDVHGPQVDMAANPFYEDAVLAYVHSMSPVAVDHPDLGSVHEPATFGDAQDYFVLDPVEMLAPIGIHAAARGDDQLADVVRWAQVHLAPGGGDELLDRVANPTESFAETILYFLLLPPGTSAPDDVRPELSTRFFAPGSGRVLARTDWGPGASWFIYSLPWLGVDHQQAEANSVEFYRNGEWLTRNRTGYGFLIGNTEWKNTVSVENDRPDRPDDDYRIGIWESGSQWVADTEIGDPDLVARSFGEGFVHVSGDATSLYNSSHESIASVGHVSRSLVWVEPDHIVIYDRAETLADDRFKRVFFQLLGPATVDGSRAVSVTPGGQQLVVTSLLPENAAIDVSAAGAVTSDDFGDEVANDDPIRHRLRVEADARGRSVRFLHVLQGTDGGATPDDVELIRTDDGSFEGTLVTGHVVLFPTELSYVPDELRYTVPGKVDRHLITGLEPGGSYSVEIERTVDRTLVSIASGGVDVADEGGVLDIRT